MKKMYKKIVSLMLVVVLGITLNISAFAADNQNDYKEILNRINQEYKLNLGYVPVDENKISLMEYEEKTRALAIQQRELLDYIDSLQKCENSPATRATGDYVKKTRTKDVSGMNGTLFSITATYTVYDNLRISSYSSATLNTKTAALIQNVYLTNITGPEFVLINTTRTLAVKYIATIHYDSVVGYDNVSLYAEFNYND